ncbi:MAG TPA: nickel-type superoxide dismutase maturation protease [Mycobacteriales bacterium]
MRLPWFRLAVNGVSMIPTLAPGEWVVVRRTRTPAPGSAVVVKRPDRYVVKRAVRVADGGWWVEGDNAAASDDSRTFGPVPADAIVGEVRWRYRPLRAAGRVR